MIQHNEHAGHCLSRLNLWVLSRGLSGAREAWRMLRNAGDSLVLRVNSCPHPWCKALACVSIPKGSLENTGALQMNTIHQNAHNRRNSVTGVKAMSSCCAKSIHGINAISNLKVLDPFRVSFKYLLLSRQNTLLFQKCKRFERISGQTISLLGLPPAASSPPQR